MRITLTRGLPASGKSTWAKKQLARGNIVRINKDDLRSMLNNGKWSKTNEKIVLKIRDEATIVALNKGYNVIIDDTNLHEKHFQRMLEIAKDYTNCEVKIKEFTEIPLEECIKRDLKRENTVGEKVIRDMYNTFLAPKIEHVEHDPNKETIIIVDIDGTLAHMNNRSPFDWMSVGDDTPDTTIIRLVNILSEFYKVIVFSGRDSVSRDITKEWLKTNNVTYNKLYMRDKGDMRKDTIIKKELFEKHIKDKYNVEFILDDRNQVVDMWRNELGLKCLQVAEGDF